jgi:hypothetical protein
MAITAAPVLGGSPSQTSVLLDVIMAWDSWQSTTPSLPGWHLVNAAELGVTGLSLTNGVYANANAEAIVAVATYNGHRTLAIGFRGTNDNEDWRDDFQNINRHYELFAPLLTALDAAVARGEFDLVLAGGHSLGGAMTQMFMADYGGIAPAFAITTGAPGYLQDAPVADTRLINYQVSDDPIVYLGDNRASVGQTLSGPLGAALVAQISSTLASSFGFSPALFAESVPFLTKDYVDRGTNIMLQVPGHPATPPASLLTFVSTYNASAHEFPAYVTGIGLGNQNPFDLGAGSRGTAGNDVLFGTTGTDTINGAAGADTLYLHINRASATITLGSGGPTGVASADSGTDTLVGVERLAFTDKRLAFDLGSDQSAGKAVRVIGAAFDAGAIAEHPDWIGAGMQLLDAGMSLLEACGIVVQLMGNPSDASFVDTVFNNVVGRLPSGDERLHYTGMLQGSGGSMTQAELLQLAANVDVNAANIGLVGLQTTGVEYV